MSYSTSPTWAELIADGLPRLDRSASFGWLLELDELAEALSTQSREALQLAVRRARGRLMLRTETPA